MMSEAAIEIAPLKEGTSEINKLERSEMSVEENITQLNDQGEVSSLLPEASEVMETIDTSSASCHSPQEELVILNLDFEEMAQAMLGQMDLVGQLLSGDIDAACNSAIPNEYLSDFIATDALDSSLDNNTPDSFSHVSDLSDVAAENLKQDKKREKSEINKKSKEDRNIEHVMKALSSLKSPEEKLLAICKKYVDLLEDHRILQQASKKNERKILQSVKEKEQLKSEHSKAILTRSRLESLCRELQRQNKVVKDESLMRVREEEEKRKEVSTKFQTTFNEITGLMQDSNQKSTKLREENLDLAQKLKSLIDQYELREQQVDKIVQHKDLEVQLSEAKLAKANMLMNEEREKLLQEKHKCLKDLAEYQKKCHELTRNEVQLRSQLALYTDKYEEFQTTLNKSNEIFSHFKKEMDQMSKKIKKLEKETGTWRNRWESSNKALVEMAAEKQHRDIEYVNATKKIVQLEKLCRALQSERQIHLNQLKDVKSSLAISSGSEEALLIKDEILLDSSEIDATPVLTNIEGTSEIPVIEKHNECNDSNDVKQVTLQNVSNDPINLNEMDVAVKVECAAKTLDKHCGSFEPGVVENNENKLSTDSDISNSEINDSQSIIKADDKIYVEDLENKVSESIQGEKPLPSATKNSTKAKESKHRKKNKSSQK